MYTNMSPRTPALCNRNTTVNILEEIRVTEERKNNILVRIIELPPFRDATYRSYVFSART